VIAVRAVCASDVTAATCPNKLLPMEWRICRGWYETGRSILQACGYRRRKKLQSDNSKNREKGVTLRFIHVPVQGKQIPVPAWTDLERSWRLRQLDVRHSAHEFGKVVKPYSRAVLTPSPLEIPSVFTSVTD